MKRRRFGLPRGYGRDPFRVRLKAITPHSKDKRQPALGFTAQPAPIDSPWPQHQVDLEEYVASLGEEPKP